MAVTLNVTRGLAALLRDRGTPINVFLAEAGLGTDVLEQPLAPDDGHALTHVVAVAYRLTNDPALGLSLGMSAPPSLLSVAGQLLMSCPTLRSAFSEAERFMPLFLSSGRLRLREEGDLGYLAFEPGDAHEATRFVTEFVLSFVLRVGFQFASRAAAPVEVRVRHAAPSYAALYEQAFAAPTRFGAERDEIVFHREVLDIYQPFADESLRVLMRHRAEDLLLSTQLRDSVHSQVRVALLGDPSLSDVDADSVARKVGMSPRSLRRRLRQEGVLLSDLVDELRREISFRELLHADTPIKQIADRVGFSEVSAFHRAFKRWTGVTPAKYRAQGGFAQAS
jgi:AraC-like DNA-binding protein